MLDKLEEYKDAAFIFFEYGEYQKAMDKTAVKVIDIHGANEYKIISKTRAASRGSVIENARMLISHEENVDYYSIPGGGLEKGETPEEGCIREIREETGYLVKPVCHFLTINEYYEEYKYTSYYFLCAIIGKLKQNLTANEIERGLVPKWTEPDKMLEIYAKHGDYASTDEERRGAYMREYTALSEYLERYKKAVE